MNLTELFIIQRALDEAIERNHPTERLDRIEKKFLALYTEIAECANEWRGFKFWSTNQEARTKVGMGLSCPGQWRNPLLEEYVDAIHFLLSLGLEFGFEKVDFQLEAKEYDEMGTRFKERTITRQFNGIYYTAAEFESNHDETDYIELVLAYLALGGMLGFTWEQIERAYFSKNQINHQRQQQGY